LQSSHVLSITSSLVLVVGGNVNLLSSADGVVVIVDSVSSSDLRALGVKSNGDWSARLSALCLAGVVDDRLVVCVLSVGEVHADDVKTGITEHVDLLGGVGLRSNGADDGCAAVVVLGLVLGVEGREPLHLG
jgi:hypothetical protein